MARKRVIELEADATLSKNQSGSLVVFNKAAGVVATLPNAGRGLEFEFVVRTDVTSNAYKVIGDDSASMQGVVSVGSGAGNTMLDEVADGITHVALSMNGTTTGGLQGTHLKFVCDEDGMWHVSGSVISGDGEATPFATS